MNRTTTLELLDTALAAADGAGVAAVFVDLDRFKQVNDDHGHDVGDLVLLAVAARPAPLDELLGRRTVPSAVRAPARVG